MAFKCGEIVSFQSFADSSHRDIFERQVQCVLYILLNLPLPLTAVGRTLQRTPETEINDFFNFCLQQHYTKITCTAGINSC